MVDAGAERGDQLERRPGCASTSASIRSVTVGTRTSAVSTASISSRLAQGLVVKIEAAAKSSIIRVSIGSGSLRVTMTNGFCGGMVSAGAQGRDF